MVFEDLSFDEKIEIWWKIADISFNSLSKFIWDEKIMTGFTGPISSTRIGHSVLMMDIKVSKDKTTLAEGLTESISCMLIEIASKLSTKKVTGR